MGLLENIHSEHISELPLREALLVKADESIRSAISLMKSKRLGCVIVVDNEEKPLGTFTERSIITLLATKPGVIDSAQVSEHLDTNWTCVAEHDPISSVVEKMQEDDARFAVVVDGQGKAVALTGQKGLMEYVAEHYPQQVMVQRVGCKPPEKREGA